MAQFVQDSLTEASDVALESHTGETGANWSTHPGYSSLLEVNSSADLMEPKSTGTASTGYYTSGVPAGADYTVTTKFIYGTTNDDGNPGITARMSTSADTHYMFRWEDLNNWQLHKAVGGSYTLLDSAAASLTAGTYTEDLECNGTSIAGKHAGSTVVSATDSSITSAGRAGVRWYQNSANQTDLQYDDYEANDIGGGGVVLAERGTGRGVARGVMRGA